MCRAEQEPAEPGYALTLPSAALGELAEENRRLHNSARAWRKKATKLAQELNDLKLADAGRKARLETIEEVLAALQGNLEDLRSERDRVRESATTTQRDT